MLDRIVASVVDEVHPECIVLFGSRARDDAEFDSDIDLLVIEEEPFGRGRSRRLEMARIWKALPRRPVGADVLLFTSDEVKRWRGTANHVIARAFREGRVLYQRP